MTYTVSFTGEFLSICLLLDDVRLHCILTLSHHQNIPIACFTHCQEFLPFFFLSLSCLLALSTRLLYNFLCASKKLSVNIKFKIKTFNFIYIYKFRRQTSVCEVLCPTICMYDCMSVAFFVCILCTHKLCMYIFVYVCYPLLERVY